MQRSFRLACAIGDRDTAVGYHFDRHAQMKIQSSFTRQNGRLQQGPELVAAQLTLRL